MKKFAGGLISVLREVIRSLVLVAPMLVLIFLTKIIIFGLGWPIDHNHLTLSIVHVFCLAGSLLILGLLFIYGYIDLISRSCLTAR
jgi:hypothetical protein